MEEVCNNNNSTTKINNRDVNPEIMVINDGQEPSKSESETIIKVEELFTPRIPRVPPMMRNHENNKGMFDPKRVSIGPYHHGKEDLQLVENIKPMVATLFLQDSGKNLDEVYKMILEKVVDDARSYYVKRSINEYDREQFAKMMLLDGCFILAIIEDYFTLFANRKSKYDDVKNHLGIFPWFSTIQDIFYLVENQLPFQVLELLMSLKFKEDDHDEGMISINKLMNFLMSMDARHFQHKEKVNVNEDDHDEGMKSINKLLQNKEKVNVNETGRESFHLLQLLRTKYLNLNKSLHILESQMGTKKEKDKFQCKQCLKDYIWYLFCFVKKVKFHCMRLKILRFVRKHKYSKPTYNLMEYVRSFRSVTELKAKGIYFMPNSSLSRQDIEFKSCCFYGRLELHPFMVTPTTKLFYSNMLAYELVSSTRYEDTVISSYIDFMKSLIDNQDDVKELRSKHILFNNLGSDQEVANVLTHTRMSCGGFRITITAPPRLGWPNLLTNILADHGQRLLSSLQLVYLSWLFSRLTTISPVTHPINKEKVRQRNFTTKFVLIPKCPFVLMSLLVFFFYLFSRYHQDLCEQGGYV